MKATGYVAVPNWIIKDKAMYDTTKKTLVAMLAYSRKDGAFCKSQTELAEITGFCRTTIAQAISELSRRGVLMVTKKYYFSSRLNRIANAKNRYLLCRCSTTKGSYTLIPRSLLQEDLTPSEFTVALHIYRLSGRKGRCFPSLRRLAKLCDHAKATICKAVKRLWGCQAALRLRCKMVNRSYSCNSYYPTDFVRAGKKWAGSDGRGGLKFRQHPVIKKITKDFTGLKTINGVDEFGNLPKNWTEEPMHWSGAGVLVSVTEEQFLSR